MSEVATWVEDKKGYYVKCAQTHVWMLRQSEMLPPSFDSAFY